MTDQTPQFPPAWCHDAERAIADAIEAEDGIFDGPTSTPGAIARIIDRHAPTVLDDSQDHDLTGHDPATCALCEARAEVKRLQVGIAKLLASSLAAQGREADELKNDPILAKHYPAEVYGLKLLGEM